ncbi:MAG: hypothetical protein C0466_09720 [Candidatus Accumulibacter sp.]|nr:hypothetical protein [Accumulibacter sp.]
MTLVELVLFMVIVGVGVAGLVSVTGSLVRSSPDPMLRKQMLAIAESLLNEVLQQPFTWCDPDDAKAADPTTKSTADCTGGAAASQDKGGGALTSPTPEAAGDRKNFDNVADYGGFSQANIGDAAGNNAMTGYTASVAIERAGNAFGLTDAAGSPDDAAALKVTVTVQRAGLDDLQLTGYRFRYAPRL